MLRVELEGGGHLEGVGEGGGSMKGSGLGTDGRPMLTRLRPQP